MEEQSNQGKSSSRGLKYFYYLMFIMGMVHITDVVVSNVSSLTTTAVAYFYYPIASGEMTLEQAQGEMGLISMISIIVILFQPLIKTGTDKYGRKPMIILSVLGMAIGNLVIGFAPSIWIYIAGSAISTYFLMADIQLLMIAEESPKEKRGFWIMFAIFIGNLSTLLVPWAKGFLISDDYTTNNWQIMYIVGAILGVILAVVMQFTMKESKAFESAKEKGELEIRHGKKFSFVNAIRDLKSSESWKTWIWYLVGGGILFMIPTIIFRSYTETILSSAAYGYTESEKNVILYIRIAISVTWLLVSGLLADKIGRKKVLLIDQTMFLVGEILFLIFIKQHSTVMVGIAWAMMFGGTWGFMNLNVMATNEILPTKLRASSSALGGLIGVIFMLIPMVLFNGLLASGAVSYDIIFYIGIPFTLGVLTIVAFKYRETKGIVLEDIKE